MSEEEVDLDVSRQLEELRKQGKLSVRPSRRCRVCRDEDLRPLVNLLIGRGLTIRDVLAVLEQAGINVDRPKNEKITYDTLWNHYHNHYDIQSPARALWRHVNARRATEEGRNLDTAVGGAVNTLSFLDTVVMKAYQTLIDEMTVVSVDQGVNAALKLHELTRKDAGVAEVADLLARQNAIIAAMREVVPEVYHEPIMAIIEGRQAKELVARVEEDEDAFDPRLSYDEDDEE